MIVRVLLVDDEPDITDVLGKGLQKYGFEVAGFNSPSSALQNYKPAGYDFILLDIKMPELNGFELAKSIWKIDPDARICFLTSFENYEQEAAAVFPSTKHRCFLRKPMTIERLASHIQTQLALPSTDLPTF
jgi:two-component system, OmpR family, response regulator